MSYSVTDIAGLAEYHLVASAQDDDAAHSNLLQLVQQLLIPKQLSGFGRNSQQLELMAPRPLWREATWVFCDRCGCSVDTDLIHPDGHHYAEDGDFYCADCWELV